MRLLKLLPILFVCAVTPLARLLESDVRLEAGPQIVEEAAGMRATPRGERACCCLWTKT